MKKLLISAMILGMAGCSSMNELRNTKPIFSADSDKAPNALSECILQSWQQQTTFDVFMQPKNGGYTVYLQGQWEIADISPKENGSHVSLYKQKTLYDGAYQKYTEWAKNCL